jgi:3'(2'), 5'-bisphosphate nucleotidase
MYYGVKGHGAYQHIDHSEEKRLHVNSFSLADENLKVVTSRNHIDDGTRVYLEKLNNPNLISMGSALKFINIANGKADYYPRMIQIMEWDTAAGQIIIEEAGGSLVNANTGKPLTYNKPGMINPYFIASGKII